MPEQHGGYRKPSSPAAVSGPGAMSARTDGGPSEMLASGGEYGSRKQMREIQQGADMTSQKGSPGQAVNPGPDASSLTPLGAPTARPDESVLAGLGNVPDTTPTGDGSIEPGARERIVRSMPTLIWAASQPQASEQLRNYVRSLRSAL